MSELPKFDGSNLHHALGENLMSLMQPVDRSDGATEYEISFRHPVQPDLIASAFHEPVAAITPDARYGDVAKGLRSVTYPNSRIARYALRHIEGANEAYRGDTKNEAAFLARRIDEWASDDLVEYRVKTPVYHHMLAARLEAEESMRAVKPLDFKELAARAGIVIDDLQVRRLQKRRAEHRAIDIEDYLQGLSDDDHGGIVDVVYGDQFAEVDVTDRAGGDKFAVIVPRKNLPPDFDGLRVERAVLGRESNKDTVIPEHRLSLWYLPRPSAIFVHLAWLRGVDGKRSFNVTSPDPVWEAKAGRLEFTSRLLGAALLAGHPDQIEVDYTKLLKTMHYERDSNDRVTYPRYLSGVLPLLLRHQENIVLSSAAFITQAEDFMDSSR